MNIKCKYSSLNQKKKYYLNIFINVNKFKNINVKNH